MTESHAENGPIDDPFGHRQPSGTMTPSLSQAFVPEGAGSGQSWDFEARLGDVLMKMKPDDLDPLKYTSTSQPVEFEK